MVMGGKDMYRGGMDIYNSVYWGLGVDLGKTILGTMFGRKSHQHAAIVSH
jgi:hypothetical protein